MLLRSGTLIVKGFGFNTLNTTLLQIPYGTFIAVMILGAIYVNHLTHERNIRVGQIRQIQPALSKADDIVEILLQTLLMAAVTVLTVIGFALVAFTNGSAPRLIGYCTYTIQTLLSILARSSVTRNLPFTDFLQSNSPTPDLTGSSNAVLVLALSLISGNVGGSTKKALSSASIFLGVAIGNIVGPFCFIDSQAPTYRTGIIVCMCSRAAEVSVTVTDSLVAVRFIQLSSMEFPPFQIVVILALRVLFVRTNKKRDQMLAAGDESCDPTVEVYDDISDTRNNRFRYIT